MQAGGLLCFQGDAVVAVCSVQEVDYWVAHSAKTVFHWCRYGPHDPDLAGVGHRARHSFPGREGV